MKFAFTVKDETEHPWDVYRVVKDGKRGTLAFCYRDGRWVIGILEAGALTEQQVIDKLNEQRQ